MEPLLFIKHFLAFGSFEKSQISPFLHTIKYNFNSL